MHFTSYVHYWTDFNYSGEVNNNGTTTTTAGQYKTALCFVSMLVLLGLLQVLILGIIKIKS